MTIQFDTLEGGPKAGISNLDVLPVVFGLSDRFAVILNRLNEGAVTDVNEGLKIRFVPADTEINKTIRFWEGIGAE